MLELHDVSAGYGRAEVLHGASLRVGAGEIVALIGANGAGKSTLIKTISGLLALRGGRITLDGAGIDALPCALRVGRGIVHMPEGRQIFASMSLRENLMLGAYRSRDLGSAGAMDRRIAESLRHFPALRARLSEPGGNLSGGQQQMLAIARGLMSRPRVLLLDEPSLGLSPRLTAEIFHLLGALRGDGMAILLAEQNARQSLAIADRAHVLENGRIVLGGSGAALLAREDIGAKYLGLGVGVGAGGDSGLRERLRGVLGAGGGLGSF